MPVTPDDTPQLSTCPILKSQMFSGDWLILLFGNNEDEASYAYQRLLHLTVGQQITSTITPTITWDITTTPISTSFLTSTVSSVETVPNTQTVTSPLATAKTTTTPTSVR